MASSNTWADVIPRVERLVYQVKADAGRGTAFAISVATPSGNQHHTMFATAWHVVEGAVGNDATLDLVGKDGVLVSGLTTGPVSVYPVGPPEYDAAMIVVPTRVPLVSIVDLHAMPLETMLNRGAELGWLGYPALAAPDLCFFRGNVSGHRKDPPCYLVDGVGINGVSGGPAFDADGLIVGMVSSYIPNQENRGLTLPGLLTITPMNLVRLWMQQLFSARVIER
jgi:hypothetical protein